MWPHAFKNVTVHFQPAICQAVILFVFNEKVVLPRLNKLLITVSLMYEGILQDHG